MWGQGYFGKFESPVNLKFQKPVRDFAVSRGGHAVILTQTGELYTWGENSSGQLGHGDMMARAAPTKLQGLQTIKHFATGDDFLIAIPDHPNKDQPETRSLPMSQEEALRYDYEQSQR